MRHTLFLSAFILLLSVVLPNSVKASESRLLNEGYYNGKVVTIAIGYDKPPYIHQDTESGYFLELIRAAFADQKIKVVYQFMPTRRLLKFDTLAGIDAIGGAPMVNKNNCHSTRFMQFENVVVSAKEIGPLGGIEEVKDRTVIGFQNAKVILGQAFRDAMDTSKFYYEVDSQKKQVRSFLKGRFEIAVMDRNIFNYWRSYFKDDESLERRHVISRLFEWKKSMGLEFKDPALCKSFNTGLAHLEKTGFIERLKKRTLVPEPKL